MWKWDGVQTTSWYPEDLVIDDPYIELYILPFVGSGFELFYDILWDYLYLRKKVQKL